MTSQHNQFNERMARLNAKSEASREETRRLVEERKRAVRGGVLSQKRASGRLIVMILSLLAGLFLLGPLIPNIMVTLGYDQERLMALVLSPRRLVFFGIAAFGFFTFVRNHPQALALGSFVMGTLFGAVLVLKYTDQVIEIEKVLGLEGQIIPEQGWVAPDPYGYEAYEDWETDSFFDDLGSH